MKFRPTILALVLLAFGFAPRAGAQECLNVLDHTTSSYTVTMQEIMNSATGQLDYSRNIQNMCDASRRVRVMEVSRSLAPNTNFTICWGPDCYTPNAEPYMVPAVVTINPNETDGSFKFSLIPLTET